MLPGVRSSLAKLNYSIVLRTFNTSRVVKVSHVVFLNIEFGKGGPGEGVFNFLHDQLIFSNILG